MTKIIKFWQELSPFCKNITFGIAITLILLTFRNGQLVAEIEDSSADWMMTLFRGKLVKPNTPPFVILDIDDDSIWFSFAIPWTAVQIRQGFDF